MAQGSLIGRAFAEHWKGVAAGLVIFNLAMLLMWVVFPPQFIADSGTPTQEPGTFIPVVMESPATSVVEDPYALPETAMRWAPLVCAVLLLLVSGATAARIGERVVAWRGAVVGVLGMLEIWALGGGGDTFEATIGAVVLGALTYAGGGLMKLLVWARTRAA